MIIKNRFELDRKHPDFDNGIEIISSIAQCVETLVNSDLVDYASNQNWTIESSYFFLSSQPMRIHCYDEDNKTVLALLFEKDGFCHSYYIYNSELISIACGADVADILNILIFTGGCFSYNVSFTKHNEYRGTIVFSDQNGHPIIERYTFEYDD